jgi:drug/metabolite transporter superfamily protein YnfA
VTPVPSVPQAVRDLLAVVTLLGLALWGLDDSLSSRSYLAVAAVGLVMVTGLAVALLAAERSTALFLLIALPGYVVVGSMTALGSFTQVDVPTPSGLVDVLAATITAPVRLLTTIPPVDGDDSVLVLPHFLGFVLGGAAVWTALRTRRPALPLVPLLLALAVCILLATESPQGLALRSLAFAVVSLAWVASRAADLRPVLHRWRGVTGRVLAGAVAVALVAAVVWEATPRLDAGAAQREVLRGRVGAGEDVSQLDNPLAGFRKFTVQPDDPAGNLNRRRLLHVTGLPTNERLRFVTLDTYDGATWNAGNATVAGTRSDLFQRIGSVIGSGRSGRPARVQVEVTGSYASSWLPLAGQLTGLSFDFRDGRAQRDDVRYNPATATAMVRGALVDNDDYTFSTVLPDERLRASMTAYPHGGDLQPAGAFLDPLLRPWAQADLSPVGKVLSLARYLRTNGRYSDGGDGAAAAYGPGHDVARLGKGFFGSRRPVGDDEQYAAFVALAANRLGVPARVVVGARPGPRGWVRGRDVFAWVELRVGDGSWRVLPLSTFMSHRPPRRSEPPRTSPERYVEVTTPQATERPTPRPADDTDTTGTTGPRQDRPGLPWWVLLPSVVWVVPALKWLRRRRRRRLRRISVRFAGGWSELLDLAVDQARPVPSELPRVVQARLLGRGEDLARFADEHVFAPVSPGSATADAFWRGIDRERRAMARDVGPVRRVLAFWNPRSLVRRRTSHPPAPLVAPDRERVEV